MLSTSCWGTPFLAIQPTRTAAGYEFKFKQCSRNAPAAVYHLTVARLNDQGRSEAVQCELLLKTGSASEGGEVIRDRWTYGERPHGFEMKVCSPLVADRRYRITATGGGGGLQDFRVEKDGTVTLQNGDCEYRE